MGDFVRVVRTDEIEPGQARLIDAKGTRIALRPACPNGSRRRRVLDDAAALQRSLA
jgi:hypothetical protein